MKKEVDRAKGNITRKGSLVAAFDGFDQSRGDVVDLGGSFRRNSLRIEHRCQLIQGFFCFRDDGVGLYLLWHFVDFAEEIVDQAGLSQ